MLKNKLLINGLSVSYYLHNRIINAVENVFIELKEGESLGIAGESGCGKSTLVSAIMRNITPPGKITTGSILLDGEEITKLSDKDFDSRIRWKKISLIFQGALNSLDPVYTIKTQIRDIFESHGQSYNKEKVLTLLENVGLELEEIGDIFHSSHPLPIDPTGRLESAIDKRLDARALDLRNENVSKLFVIRSIALEIIRKTLREMSFLEVNTPKIIGSASEGGANLFEFDYFKNKAYLAQSPQLYKEQLILALDRVFEIAPYFRAEKSNTVRHLTEFYSVDIEAAFLDYYDIMEIMERVIKKVIHGIKDSGLIDYTKNAFVNKSMKTNFERLTYSSCIEELKENGECVEYGDDLSDSSLRKLGQLHTGFYFITDWPLKLKPFYILENEKDPFLSDSFDLQIGYLELISGGTRQHDPSKIRNRLSEQGLNPSMFSDHLKVFDWGMPPHAGCGLGLDRLMMCLTGSMNVREVVLYPRDPYRINP